MSQSTPSVSLTPRLETGSAASRNLRRAGQVPCVIYGLQQPLAVTGAAKELQEIVHHPSTIRLEIAGEAEPRLAVVRQHQNNYLGMQLDHVDFQEVLPEQLVTIEVAVNLHGDPVGMARGGQLRQMLYTLELRVPAGAILDHIDADVVDMELNDKLHISDLALPQGAIPVLEGRVLVAQVTTGRGGSDDDDDDDAGE